ncbi:MAG: DUF4234 domain-containing protein [Bacteriovoracaceae bacterium]|jgi:hypothetical protein|nr:DUF4234 domain-containing protein [Bacteriovoracaceae bacterium]
MVEHITGEHIRSVVKDIVITILTCGLFNIYIQYVQIGAVNDIINEEKYSFVHWFLFTIITCGLYHIYHEYRMTEDICRGLELKDSNEPLVNLMLSVFGLCIVADAIQQGLINKYYGSDEL